MSGFVIFVSTSMVLLVKVMVAAETDKPQWLSIIEMYFLLI